GGRMTIEGLDRGSHVLLVTPADESYQPSGFLHFEIPEQGEGAPEQKVTLLRTVTRTLRIVRSDGRAVAGTEVQLLRPLTAEPISLLSYAMTIDRLGSHTGPRAALLVQQGTTNAAGELVLRGPPAGKLALRIRGPDHAPLIENDVTLA